MSRQIALLRGVNLGPNRRVSMSELRELLDGHGHADVRTYLQSGNVVLSSDLPPAKLQRELERQIEDGLGVAVPVVVRTRDELAGVIERNPLADVATEPRRLQVTFFTQEPDAKAVAALEQLAVGGERIALSGREVYAWHPDGLARSELGKQLAGRKLGGTARNWNTVTKLLELADA